MISDEHHPYMVAASEEFMRRATEIVVKHNGQISQAYLDDLDGMARGLRSRMRGQGIDFPYLTAFILNLPGRGWHISVYPAEFDARSVRNAVFQTLRECVARGWQLPSRAEVVAAMVAAWPHIRYLPKFDIADEGEYIARQDQARLAAHDA